VDALAQEFSQDHERIAGDVERRAFDERAFESWKCLVDAMERDMKIPRAEADKLAPASIPMGRIAEVEEVANLVVMLASPLMDMVNGTMIEIDGGQDKPLMDRFRDKPRG